MYQALLTRRYLFSKVMPLLASVAVLLCTCMVIVIWSVMGGFLNMLIGTGRTLTGDVSIIWPTTGFRHYEDLIARLEKDPMVAAAAPMIEAPGMIRLPDGRNEWVLIRGIEGGSYAKVTEYEDILWWKPLDRPLPKDTLGEDPRLPRTIPDDPTHLTREFAQQLYDNGLNLERTNPATGVAEPAVVLGMEVSRFNQRELGGFYTPRTRAVPQPDGSIKFLDMFLPRSGQVTLNVLPTDTTGKGIETATAIFPVANEFQSGLYETDKQVVLVRLDALQKMLRMQAYTAAPQQEMSGDEGFAAAPEAGPVQVPGRVTHVLVRGAGSEENSAELKARVQQIYDQFAREHRGDVPDFPTIATWREMNGTFITAVEKETALVLVLFCLVSLVAVVLVLSIFWSMVAEKTKDIGILRAMGASRTGVAWIWVRYGLAIGIVGAITGAAAAWGIVHNINPIHEWMGRAMDIQIWDPRVYYFIQIPNQVNYTHMAIVMAGFVLSCAVGAAIPAGRAAMLHPVRALRFE
jgi:lipoprotein-releasing system permease protein